MINEVACTQLSEGRNHTVAAYRKLNVITMKCNKAVTPLVSKPVKVEEVDSTRLADL